jgi:hypothetical protein
VTPALPRIALAVVALVTPIALPAQTIIVRDGADRPSAAIIREATSHPHVVRAGHDRFEVSRDSIISSTLVVIGRPTYLAGRVDGDVIVVGADLFLRPGVNVSGRAVALGGTVAETSLGRVDGGTASIRDEVYVSSVTDGRVTLDFRDPHPTDPEPLFQGAGLQGLLPPMYERVSGLSLPVGALLTLARGNVEVEPFVTYRSRLGAFDPGGRLRIRPDQPVRFEGVVGRDTRSNDTWIYSNLLNSATSFYSGLDTRNYFRSTGGEGRLFARIERSGLSVEPYVGGRYERVEAISAAGNVFSVFGRHDDERMARPNPFVENNRIGSVLLGGAMFDTSGVVVSRIRAELEQSLTTSDPTTNFTQLTIEARVAFPTFDTQRLQVRLHGVATAGDVVPRSRYAYIGGAGSIVVLDLLEQGGAELLYMENRYIISFERFTFPIIGSPSIDLVHIMGSAGVRSLPRLVQEIGMEIGLSALRFGVFTDANGQRGTAFSFGLSLPP